MTGHSHRREECRHGVLVAQCRCLGSGAVGEPDRVTIVECPTVCLIGQELSRMRGEDPDAGFDWREAQS